MKELIEEITLLKSGGENGKVYSKDNDFILEAKDTHPGKLLGAAYSSCFNNTLLAILKDNGIDDVNLTVEVTTKLFRYEEIGKLEIGIDLNVIFENMDYEKAIHYVDIAHTYCPVSKALKGSTDINISVSTNK